MVWNERKLCRVSLFSLVCGTAACGGTTVASGGTLDKAGARVDGGSRGGSETGGFANGASGARSGGGGRFGGGGFVPSTGGAAAFSGAPGSGGFFETGGSREGGSVSRSGAPGSGGTFGTGGSVEAGTGIVPTSCLFTFSVTTVSYNGRFEPRNVGAIWITDEGNAFVKTLATWGGPRLAAAIEWETVSGGNRVDAITSATRANAGPTTAEWNCTDTTEHPVPLGNYFVCVEFEEEVPPSIGSTHFTCVPFSLRGNPSQGSWADEATFVSMSWSLE